MNVEGPISALVPMRHMSQRVPGKNYRPLAGKPLYRHVIDALIASSQIARIAIDTDSKFIIDDVVNTYTDRVEIVERPEHLAAPNIPMNEILMHDVSTLGGEIFLQTHSTNPMLRAETIARAVEFFRNLLRQDLYDSLFSVTRNSCL